MDRNQKNTNKSSKSNHGLRNTLINVFIVIFSFTAALGLFISYRNFETERERNNLVPRAKDSFAKGDYSQAINIYITAENEFPDNIEIKRALGELYYFKGKYQDTVKYLEAVKSKESLTKKETSYLGNSYIAVNKTDEAITLFSTSELDPEDTYKLANLYRNKNDSEKYFLELAKISDFQEPLIFSQVRENNIANILVNIDKATNAKKLSDEIIDIDLFKSQIAEAKKQFDFNKKDYAELIQLAAFTNLNQCNFVETRIQTLKTSLANQKVPTYQVEFLEGKCANQAGDPDAAIALINKAIAAETTNLDYREELAKSYFLKKDLENLKKTYNDIFLIKKTAEHYTNYAAFLYKMELKSESIENYKTALSLASDNSSKESLSTTIMQIEFIDNKNIDACSNEDIVANLNYEIAEQYLIRSTCDAKNDVEIQSFTNNQLYTEYIRALKNRDKVAVEKVLDRDREGVLSGYYNAVGVKVLQ